MISDNIDLVSTMTGNVSCILMFFCRPTFVAIEPVLMPAVLRVWIFRVNDSIVVFVFDVSKSLELHGIV